MVGGAGEPAIVIIGGGGSTAESMFSVNVALESTSRVVSLGIPTTAESVDQAVEGIRTVLEELHLERVVFLGHSLGGFIAQAFAMRHPERVAGLVLSHSAIYLGAKARMIPVASALVRSLPQSWLIHMVTSQMDRLLEPVEARAFWKQFVREELSKPGAGARTRHQFGLLGKAFADLRGFCGLPVPVQIIWAEDDRGFTRDEIENLGRLYPRSFTKIFPAPAGHLSFLSRTQEYVEVVRAFARSAA